MAKFDPGIHDGNLPMDTAFMAGMKPSSRGRPKLETPKVEIKNPSRCQDGRVFAGWQTRVNALLEKMVTAGQI